MPRSSPPFRRALLWVAATVVATLAVGASAPAGAAPSAPPPSTPTGQLTYAAAGPSTTDGGAATAPTAPAPLPAAGLYAGPAAKNPAGADAFDQLTGQRTTHLVDFTPTTSWSQIEGQSWLLGAYAQQSRTLEYSVPVVPDIAGASLAGCAKGEYDVHWTTLATNLVAAKLGGTVVRPGWEFNGNWYRWSAAAAPADFASCFRHVVTSMRAVAGQRFTFTWNVAVQRQQFPAELAWPGDDYVDVVGVDVYDQSWAWYQPGVTPTAVARDKTWNDLYRGDHGLLFWRDFAVAHGKRLALPEWGLNQMPNGRGGGDNATFVDRIFDFVEDPANRVAYATYFNNLSSAVDHRLTGDTVFPSGLAAYRQRATALAARVAAAAAADRAAAAQAAADRGTADLFGRLYVAPTAAARATKAHPSLQAIASQPQAIWLGPDWAPNPQQQIRTAVRAAQGATVQLVVYGIPGRDGGGYSAGGAASAAAYRSWVSRVVTGIGDAPAVVVLEPDALGQLADLPTPAARTQRLALLSWAATRLGALGNTRVYLDASTWVAPDDQARLLAQAGLSAVRGFAVNVSGYRTVQEATTYGDAVAALTGTPYVVDTSRAGRPTADGQWCNVAGGGLGPNPGTAVGLPHVDGFLWVKHPGESDGTCNGGPGAGTFWPRYALALVANAVRDY